jgi:hypothetical protein
MADNNAGGGPIEVSRYLYSAPEDGQVTVDDPSAAQMQPAAGLLQPQGPLRKDEAENARKKKRWLVAIAIRGS